MILLISLQNNDSLISYKSKIEMRSKRLFRMLHFQLCEELDTGLNQCLLNDFLNQIPTLKADERIYIVRFRNNF